MNISVSLSQVKYCYSDGNVCMSVCLLAIKDGYDALVSYLLLI